MEVAKPPDNLVALHVYRELCAASIRALGHQPDAFFQAGVLRNLGATINTPELHTAIDADEDADESDAEHRRALADAYVMRFIAHDQALHATLQPVSDLERLLFNMLEQLRLESVPAYPGMRRNLQTHFAGWIDDSQTSGFTDSHAGILIFTLAVACWTRLNELNVPIEIDGLIEATRHAIGVEVGAELQKLPRSKHDQKQFGQVALAIAAGVAGMLRGEHNEVQADEQARSTLQNLGLILFDSDAATTEQAIAGDSRIQGNADNGCTEQYTVYTREYDEVIDAAKLLRKEKLDQLRIELDGIVRETGINAAQCANVFRRLLSNEYLGRWGNSEEFGYLDPSCLNRIITHPEEHNVFRRERVTRLPNCHVTIVLDCSGSMKQHANTVAVLCDQLNRILGQAAICTEVLGFTTRSWNGGRPFKRWRTQGKPFPAGRLNELRHIVFKSEAQQWRRARPGIAALLQTENYREGLDGEALLWAAGRLERSRRQRKILLYISDGSPMDTSTNMSNPEGFLDSHLESVVRFVETRSDITVCSLGVGLDLSNFFTNHCYIDTSQAINNKTMLKIAKFLAEASRASQ